MNEPAPTGDSRESGSYGLVAALGSALAWATLVTARFGRESGAASMFLAVFGMAALSLGAIARVVERARSRGLSSLVLAGLLSTFPIALLGAVLRAKTHHRALGGVTFAVLAALVVAGASLVARRFGAGSARRVVLAMAAVSCLAAVRPLLTPMFGAHDGAEALLAQDFAAFLVATAVTALAARSARRHAGGRAVALVWGVAVVVGVIVVTASMPLRASLTERAPFALGLGALFGP